MPPDSEPERDFYDLLGLKAQEDVREDSLRKAYLEQGVLLSLFPPGRVLSLAEISTARLVHPDRDLSNKGATKAFQDIQEAYETLKDPHKKAIYDTTWLQRKKKKREAARERDGKVRLYSQTREGSPWSSRPSGISKRPMGPVPSFVPKRMRYKE